jgi:hypothetical protein
MSLGALSLTEAAAHIREGRISSVELVRDCLARIDEVEPTVHAWTYLDRALVLQQAEAADLHLRRLYERPDLRGMPTRPLRSRGHRDAPAGRRRAARDDPGPHAHSNESRFCHLVR